MADPPLITRPVTRPTMRAVTADDCRDNLLQAIAEWHDEEASARSLTEAREKAWTQSAQLPAKIAAAEQALHIARAEESRLIAYSYASGDYDAVSPVSAAQLALEQATVEQEQARRIANALDHELLQLDTRLRLARARVHQAIGVLVENSSEFQRILDAHRAAFHRLRTIKVTLRTIQAGLHGQGDFAQRLSELILLGEPLDIRVGFGVDEALIGAWREALLALEQDPDFDLPDHV